MIGSCLNSIILTNQVCNSTNYVSKHKHTIMVIILMVTTSSSLDQYTESTIPFYDNTIIGITIKLTRALLKIAQFNLILSNAFAGTYPIYLNAISEYNKSWKDLSELAKILRSRFRKAFDKKFREENFVNTLSDTHNRHEAALA
jgi:hypothetical protein